MLTQEQKINIIYAIIEDQTKGLIESQNLPDDSFNDVDNFLTKCYLHLEKFVLSEQL